MEVGEFTQSLRNTWTNPGHVKKKTTQKYSGHLPTVKIEGRVSVDKVQRK